MSVTVKLKAHHIEKHKHLLVTIKSETKRCSDPIHTLFTTKSKCIIQTNQTKMILISEIIRDQIQLNKKRKTHCAANECTKHVCLVSKETC